MRADATGQVTPTCRDGEVVPDGRNNQKKDYLLGLVLPAHTVCDGDKWSKGHDPSPLEVNVISCTWV